MVAKECDDNLYSTECDISILSLKEKKHTDFHLRKRKNIFLITNNDAGCFRFILYFASSDTYTSRQLPDESVCLSVYVSRIQYRSLFRKENGRESFDSENMGVQGLYQEFKERTEFSLNEIVAREGQK